VHDMADKTLSRVDGGDDDELAVLHAVTWTPLSDTDWGSVSEAALAAVGRVLGIYMGAGTTITTARAQRVARPAAAPPHCLDQGDVSGSVAASFPEEKAFHSSACHSESNSRRQGARVFPMFFCQD